MQCLIFCQVICILVIHHLYWTCTVMSCHYRVGGGDGGGDGDQLGRDSLSSTHGPLYQSKTETISEAKAFKFWI
jgi:hypothetical protein